METLNLLSKINKCKQSKGDDAKYVGCIIDINRDDKKKLENYNYSGELVNLLEILGNNNPALLNETFNVKISDGVYEKKPLSDIIKMIKTANGGFRKKNRKTNKKSNKKSKVRKIKSKSVKKGKK
jgi:hypothetical protein